MTYYTSSEMRPGKPLRVIAKDNEGIPRGEYVGYWRPESRTVTLYPAKRSWIYGRLSKVTIADRLLRRM